MSDNPYAFSGAIPAAQAPADERATFLRKVYSLLLAGILVFGASLWAAGNVPAVNSLAASLWDVIGGGLVGILIYFGLFYGGFYLVHAVARKHPINLIAYFGWCFLMALLAAPLVLYAAGAAPEALTQAAGVTALVFTGLTAFVFVTGKDFSFLRGILFLAFWVLLIVGLMGAFMGFGSPILFSGLGILFFSGFILYDTSNILHHTPTNMAVAGALELFTDVVLLFKNVLILLISLNND